MKNYILRSLIESPAGEIDGAYPIPMRGDHLEQLLMLACDKHWPSNKTEGTANFRDDPPPAQINKTDADELQRVLKNLRKEVSSREPSFVHALVTLSKTAERGPFTIEER